MIDHVTLRLVHQATVILSIIGFAFRGGLMLAESPLLYRRWMRRWPHIIDTLLAASGIAMAVNLRLNPFDHPWLTAKLVALLGYIGLGFVALRLGKTRRVRMGALIAAIACYGYIALVGLTKNPVPL